MQAVRRSGITLLFLWFREEKRSMSSAAERKRQGVLSLEKCHLPASMQPGKPVIDAAPNDLWGTPAIGAMRR